MRSLTALLSLLALAGAFLTGTAHAGIALHARPEPPLPGSFVELTDLRSACRPKTWRTLQASGYDRGGGFYDSGNFLREEPGRHFVLMDAQGPGCIDRMWFTRKSVKEPYDLLLYLDGATSPTVQIGIDELASGTKTPFVPPFTGQVDLARYSYVPIGFRRSCKAVLVHTATPESYNYRENSAGRKIPHVYYQITYRSLPAGNPVRAFRLAMHADETQAMARAAALWKAAGEWPWAGIRGLIESRKVVEEVRAGGTATLYRAKRAGVLLGLRLRLPPGEDPRGLRLEMTWDGAAEPAVSAPLGTFFAAPDPREPVRGLWLGCREGWYYCYFPMPFRQGAEIRVVSSRDSAISVTAQITRSARAPATDDLCFHARAYDHSPPLPRTDYSVLDVHGAGHFVGIVMDRPGNMEGDDRFYVDGESEPSIHGTGTEDFFNFAWGFAHLKDLPFHGITRHFRTPVLYRFMLPAAVPYTRSLRVGFEHGHGNEHQGRYSGVAFYYAETTP